MQYVSFVKRKFNAMLGVATITMAVNFLVTLVGSLIAGNMIGPDGLAGVGVCTPVFACASFFAALLSVGSGLVFSQAMGAFDERRAAGVWSQTAAIAIAVGLVTGVLMLAGGSFYMNFNGVQGEILRQAQSYWRWQALQMALTPIVLLIMAMVYSDGDSVVATIAGAVYVGGTVVFGSFFTWSFGDAGGVSAGTSMAMICVVATCAIHFFRKNNHMKFIRYFSWKDLAMTVAGSAPDATIYLCWGLLILIINSFTVKVLGHQELLAVVALGASIVQFSIVFDGIGEALIPLGGMYAGEDNKPALRELANHSALMAALEGLVCGVIMFIFAPQICPMYGFHGDKAAMLPEAIFTMRALAFASPCMGFLMMANTHYLIVGYLKLAVSVTVLKDFVFPCIAGVAMGATLGFRGLWYGFVIGYIAAAAYPFVFVLLVYGRTRFPWLIAKDNGMAINFAVRTDKPSVTGARDRVAEYLKKRNIPEETIRQVAFTMEESGSLVGERCGKNTIWEIFLTLNKPDCVRLIMRDTGKELNVLKELKLPGRGRYLNTLNCNRTEIFFDFDK